MIDALPLLLGPEGYQISRSVRLRSSASAYFNRTNGTPTSGTTWTISFWMKRGSGLGVQQNVMGAGQASGTNYFQFSFDAANTLTIGDIPAGNLLTTSQVFRDPSAWYHFVYTVDTTQATASNRTKLYVNGTQVTAFSTAVYPALNAVGYWNTNAYVRAIGNIWYNGAPGGFYFDGYLTEINFIDGQALTPASFGETNPVTGVWQPKKYVGTYGTNGFYLNFSDPSAATAAAIGKDYSGNGNNWTPNNISVTAGATYDSMLDVPTPWPDGGNGRGNYCVINPLDRGSSGTILDGNLATSSQTASANGTFGLTTGKWYFEASFSSITGASSQVEVGIQATQIQGYLNNGNKDLDTTQSAYGATFTTSDVIGCAFDLDAKQMTFYKNGASQGTFTYTVADTYFPMIRARGTTTFAGTINFGQRPFAYTPPSGFKALNTLNLPTPTILKGNQYFDVNTWSGNASTQVITNSASMQPDLVWIKKRGGGTTPTRDHRLFDAVRGATKYLGSNLTSAEVTETDGLTSFNANGFTLGASDGVNGTTGGTGTYVGWQWKEGATQGFDIVTFSGTGGVQNISHSLGVAPRMIIMKRLNGVSDWVVGHNSLPWTQALNLNLTAAASTTATAWNNTAPTSSQFTVGSFCVSGGTYAAYLFAEVAGFSRFGSYTGNGSADGPFVFCGFRPRWVMIKETTAASTSDWVIHDTARASFNADDLRLLANSSGAELNTGFPIDELSNGFKIRNTGNGANRSGGTYIFAAFAEVPFRNALAR